MWVEGIVIRFLGFGSGVVSSNFFSLISLGDIYIWR